MNPARKSLLDPTFIYRNAANTDVRLTFERVRREQESLKRAAPEIVVAVIGEPLDRDADKRRSSDRNAKVVNALRCVAKVP